MKKTALLTKRGLISNRFFPNEKGGALLMVLIFIPVLSLGAMAAYHYSSNRTNIVYYDYHRQQARYVAEAGLQRLIAEIEFNNGFIETLNEIVLPADGGTGDITRYGAEGPIEFLGGDNPDLVNYSPIKSKSPLIQLATLLNFFSVTDAHAATYGTGATYKIRLNGRDLTTDPLDGLKKGIYVFEATAKTYPTDSATDADVVVEQQIVTMKVKVSQSRLSPPSPPTCPENNVPLECNETPPGEEPASGVTNCNTLGNDGLYRYSYYAGNNITHSGMEISFFGSGVPLTYHAENQYNGKGRTGFGIFSCNALMSIGAYGCQECIEGDAAAPNDGIKIDCPGGFPPFLVTGYRGEWYGDSTCGDHAYTPDPLVKFKNVAGAGFTQSDGSLSLQSMEDEIISKVTGGGTVGDLEDGWNTGSGDFSNYHYWQGDGTLEEFNFLEPSEALVNSKNHVYFVKGNIGQFNFTGVDVNILGALSSGSVTIIADGDINLFTLSSKTLNFASGSAASLSLIASGTINKTDISSFNFIIGRAREINLISLEDIKITKAIEFNFSLGQYNGFHVTAARDVELNDGLVFSFGGNASSGENTPTVYDVTEECMTANGTSGLIQLADKTTWLDECNYTTGIFFKIKKNDCECGTDTWITNPDDGWCDADDYNAKDKARAEAIADCKPAPIVDKPLCNTTGCIPAEDTPDTPTQSNLDVKIIKLDFS